MKIISWLGYAHTALERALSSIGGLLIFILTILVPIDVFMRYALNSPIAGLFELSELMLVGMVYLSITYVQANKGHVVIDILFSKFGRGHQRFLNIFNYLLCIGVSFLITWRSGYLAWQAWDMHDYTSGLIQWPLWPAKAVVSIGCGLLCLRLIRDLWQDLSLAHGSRP